MAATVEGSKSFFQAALLGGLLVLILLLAPACGEKPPQVSPQAQAFALQTRQALAHWSELLATKTAQNDRQAVMAAMALAYQEGAKEGQPIKYGLVALDKDGYLLAARYPDTKQPEGYFDTDYPQNYGKFEVIKTALSERRTQAGTLYTGRGKAYMVCTPLTAQNQVVGALIMGYTQEELVQVLGVSEADFLGQDYTPGR